MNENDSLKPPFGYLAMADISNGGFAMSDIGFSGVKFVELESNVPFASPRRRPGGGFTFEVQQEGQEYLSRGFEAKAFARGIIVAIRNGLKAGGGALIEVCFSG